MEMPCPDAARRRRSRWRTSRRESREFAAARRSWGRPPGRIRGLWTERATRRLRTPHRQARPARRRNGSDVRAGDQERIPPRRWRRVWLWRRDDARDHIGLDHRDDADQAGQDEAVADHPTEDLTFGAHLVA